jgi:protein O-GlcNAc transferase
VFIEAAATSEFERRRAAVRRSPRNGGAWYKYADYLYHNAGQPRLALKAYERAQKLEPGVDLRAQIGSAYVRLGQFDKGIGLIRESIDRNPRPLAYLYLADAYLFRELYDAAETACRSAIHLDPSSAQAFRLLGDILRYRSTDDALEAYRHATSLRPENAEAWRALGTELCKKEEQLEQAIDALSTAARLEPDDPWTRVRLGNALWRKSRLLEANEQYEAAIKLDPNFPLFRRWHQQFVLGTRGDEADSGKKDDA